MLSLLTSFIPGPYKLLGVVAAVIGLFGAGFYEGTKIATNTAKVELAQRIAAERTAALEAQQKADADKAATTTALNQAVTDANTAAATNDAKAKQLQSQVDAYSKSLAASGCVLSADDVQRMRAIGTSGSGNKRTVHGTPAKPAK